MLNSSGNAPFARAFAAESAKTDLVSGLSAMFADDVVIPSPPGRFVEGKEAVIASLRANADNERSRTEWIPVRGAVSADGGGGFGDPATRDPAAIDAYLHEV